MRNRERQVKQILDARIERMLTVYATVYKGATHPSRAELATRFKRKKNELLRGQRAHSLTTYGVRLLFE